MSDQTINKPVEQKKPYAINDSYQLEDAPFDVEKSLIFKSLAGSHSFGMANEESDIDIRGIYVAPIEQVFNLDTEIMVVKNKDGKGDAVFYDLRKFCRMASVSEVNAIQMLYTPKESLLEVDECGQVLIDCREIFLNKRIEYSFGGLAFGNTLSCLAEEKTNKSELRKKFGYNTKMAMNSVRVIRLGSDLLETGDMKMIRNDNEELRSIRDGKLSRDEFAIIDKTDQKREGRMGSGIIGGIMYDEFQRFNKALKNTQLPDGPDKERINRIILRITGRKLGLNLEKDHQQSR